jgi:hypothetical protein
VPPRPQPLSEQPPRDPSPSAGGGFFIITSVLRGKAASDTTGGYVYDVFVSYRRDSGGVNPMASWIHEVVTRLRYWLSQELPGTDERVFFDTQALEAGSQWPDRLRHAILRSRCLVPILSPQYFKSAWCLAEWSSFVERQRLVRDMCDTLIVPMKFHDGELFPPEAKEITTLDLTRHAGTTPSFWSTARADELDQMILRFAHDVASAVRQAPPFDPSWPIRHPEPSDPPRGFPMSRL